MNNAVAGMFLALMRPLRIGDSVSIGSDSGTLKDIALMRVVLETEDRDAASLLSSSEPTLEQEDATKLCKVAPTAKGISDASTAQEADQIRTGRPLGRPWLDRDFVAIRDALNESRAEPGVVARVARKFEVSRGGGQRGDRIESISWRGRRLPASLSFTDLVSAGRDSAASLAEAVAAVDGAVAPWYERYRCVLAAFGADYRVHLARTSIKTAAHSAARTLATACCTA